MLKKELDLKDGIPEDFEALDLDLYDKIVDSEFPDLYAKLVQADFKNLKIGSQKVIVNSNYPSILLGLFKYHGDKINNPNCNHESNYLIDLVLIRFAQEFYHAVYPIHIPFSDLKTRRTFIAIENFGEVLKYESKENIQIEDVWNFIANLLKLSNSKGIPSDNTSQNLTFDELNKLRIIDVRFDQNYKIITFINEMGIRYPNLKIFDQIETNPEIYNLCSKKYKELSDENKANLLAYFQN